MNFYLLSSQTRLKTLGNLLNNFYRHPLNYNKFSHSDTFFFYLTNSEGMSVLEINPMEKEYRHAATDDLDGLKNIPKGHKLTAEYLMSLPRSRFETLVKRLKNHESLEEIMISWNEQGIFQAFYGRS